MSRSGAIDSITTGMSRVSSCDLSSVRTAPSIHLGHQDVEGDQRRTQGSGQLHAPLAAGHGDDRVSLALEGPGEEIACVGVVIDHQHPPPVVAIRLGTAVVIVLVGPFDHGRGVGVAGELDAERGAHPELALEGDIATHEPHEAASQGPGPSRSRRSHVPWSPPPERTPRRRTRACRTRCRCPVSPHPETHELGVTVHLGSDRQGDRSLGRELGGVGEEVEQGLAKLGDVGVHRPDRVVPSP